MPCDTSELPRPTNHSKQLTSWKSLVQANQQIFVNARTT